jgi:hypothetical protein
MNQYSARNIPGIRDIYGQWSDLNPNVRMIQLLRSPGDILQNGRRFISGHPDIASAPDNFSKRKTDICILFFEAALYYMHAKTVGTVGVTLFAAQQLCRQIVIHR